jgi:hypothetical protein
VSRPAVVAHAPLGHHSQGRPHRSGFLEGLLSAPYDPDRASGPPLTGPPVEVVAAVRLMFARVGIGVVNAVITLASGTATREAIRAGNPALAPAEVDEKYVQGAAVAVCLAAVVAVLYVLLALRVLHGRSWARIVTWVVAGLGVLGGVLGMFGSGTGPERGVVLVGLLVDTAIVLLLAHRRANEYFR